MTKKFRKLLSKAIFYPCLTAAISSCGKKIDSSNDTNRVSNRYQLGSSGVVLSIKTYQNNEGSSEFITPSSGWASIPPYPTIKKTNSSIIYSTITFEKNSMLKDVNTDLKCQYISLRDKNKFSHQFIGCTEDIDFDGEVDELNYRPGDEVAIYDKQKIKFEITTSDNIDDAEVESIIDIDWR